MTKKDFVVFARMIRAQRHKLIEARKGLDSEKTFFDGAEKQLNIIMDELVEIFKANPRFDPDKFRRACEIEEKK